VDRGKASRIDAPTDLPAGWKFIQWKVENADELVVFLEPYDVRMRRAPGDHMLIQGRHTGMNLQLSPGDCLVIKPATDDTGEQLGMIHSASAIYHRESETLHLEH